MRLILAPVASGSQWVKPRCGLAHPLEEIVGEASEPRFAAIAKVIEEWGPQRLVVGLPLSTDGEAHELTHRARRFARQLEGRFGLPVSLADERYTSVEAEANLRLAGAHRAIREKRIDSAAAQLILQQWFDAQGGDDATA